VTPATAAARSPVLAAGLAARGIESASPATGSRTFLPLWPHLSRADVDAIVAGLTVTLRAA
jgi:hypothetical protein